jgi:NAD(P)H dehydrogenase (quinone)
MSEILILYYSRTGFTEKMANFIARGVESITDMKARIRTVPPVVSMIEPQEKTAPEAIAPYVTEEDFKECAGLILGSPTRFGNMAAPMKHCIDQLGSLWVSNALVGKPAGVFTSTGSLHGGQETTLISMMLPLLHLGYIMVGVPYSEQALTYTTTGGTPYGASHVVGNPNNPSPISEEEKQICIALGKRVAEIAKKLFML